MDMAMALSSAYFFLTYLQVAAQSARNIHDMQMNAFVCSLHITFHLHKHVHRISQPKKKKVTWGEKTATILNFQYQSGLTLQEEDKSIKLYKSCPQETYHWGALHVLNSKSALETHVYKLVKHSCFIQSL